MLKWKYEMSYEGSSWIDYCVKSVQIRSFFGLYFPAFGPNAGEYGPKKALYLDTFHAADTQWTCEQ